MMRLRTISLLRDRVEDWDSYPFNVPAIRSLTTLGITSRICFLVGENGSGKSTLLEAVAENYGFGREGGSRSFFRETTESNAAVTPLAHALRLGFVTRRTGLGFYLRAESFFNVATQVDEMQDFRPYGGTSLHAQSHGESFLALLANRFDRQGFYIMDEPEAALSPQRQLSLLVILHDRLTGNDQIQFLIASHSPILLAYPGAQILSFDDEAIREIDYTESQPYRIMSSFLAEPARYLRHLFSELPLEEE